MLHKSFLPAITSWLSRWNRHIVSVYCSTLTSDSSSVHQKKVINTAETKELMEETGLSKVKKRKNKEKQLEYIEESILRDKETLDIINYIQKVSPDIIDFIQSMKWTLKKADTSILHLIDKDTAAKYVSLIMNDLSKNMCHVAELNPGFGILTRELLKAGVPLIHMYEGHSKLHGALETLCAKYPGKLNLISSKNCNLFGITRAFYDDKISDEKYQDSFKAVESKNWEDETYMQVIGASDSRYLFTFILHSLVFRNGFMLHGRPIFYIAILPSLWHRYNICTNSNHKVYSYTKVMFKLMFNCELLGTLSRKAFIPWPKKKRQSMYNANHLWTKQDHEQIYVIKLEPKAELYSQLSQKDWITFSYFVKHHHFIVSGSIISDYSCKSYFPGIIIDSSLPSLLYSIPIYTHVSSFLGDYTHAYALVKIIALERITKNSARSLPIVRMKCLYIGFMFFAYNYVIWGQDLSFPTDEETSHVSGGNSTMITERIPISVPDSCPKDMLLYPGDSGKDAWVCDCRPRFLYFPLNNSCHEAYRQGPCPPKNYVILPEDEAVPRCVENPCEQDGVVQYNGTCHPLKTIGGPCAPDGVIGVNETTFQLECVSTDIAPFIIIDVPTRTCPPGSRRSTLGICKKV